MRKEKTLFIVGLWIIVLPFLGFASNWKTILFILTGVATLYLAYLFYLENKNRLLKNTTPGQTFIDNIGSGE